MRPGSPLVSPLVGTAMVLAASASLAWNEPDGFRNVPWGASFGAVKEELIRQNLRTDFCFERGGASGAICTTPLSVGPVYVDPAQFVLREDKFVTAVLLFHSTQYETMRSIFVDRYGPPTEQKETPVKTPSGFVGTNERLLWLGERAAVLLERYTDRVTRSRAVIQTAEEYRRVQQKHMEELRKGKDDL